MANFKWVKQWLWVVAIAVGSSSAQAQMGQVNPVNKQREFTLYSKNYEINVGSRYYRYLVNRDGGYYLDNPKVNDYIARVGKKLAKVSDRPDLPYQFVVIDNPTPNAWALPGGKIAINTGLLKLIDTEDELAAVLAHEIVHAAARHRVQDWERSLATSTITTLRGIVAPGQTLLTNLLKTEGLDELKLSRDTELEADEYGIEYMARAGYDLNAAVTVQEKMAKYFKKHGESHMDELHSTHPNFSSRIAKNKELIKKYPSAKKKEAKNDPYKGTVAASL